MMETIAKHDLPTAPVVDKALVVGGVRFDTRGTRCWAPDPQRAACAQQYALSWTRGDAASGRAWIEDTVRNAMLGPVYGPGYRYDRVPGRCVIGGVERDCERVDYYGATPNVVIRQYFGTVTNSATTTVLECEHRANEAPSILCKQAFGSFTKVDPKVDPKVD